MFKVTNFFINFQTLLSL